ncbi:Methyl-accepting chemotaxis protein [hydrothermal vent metagenome]|uniref:Methyl-accepting chemotaxis protein n=1 Tax=hydrothermal vent metagenome TaxID=652676 RepID=A0A1W1C3Z8_9ZZZZ
MVTPTDVEQEIRKIDIIVSKGDKDGNITYANPIFFKLSGYSQSELLEKSHSKIRHPDMPKIIFKHFWEELNKGLDVFAFVKNLSKDGSFYWVYAHVRVAKNPNGSFRNYVSTRKTMNPNARLIIEDLYKNLLDREAKGEDASVFLEEFIQSQGQTSQTFNDVMIALQNS